jgi:hypothetical protein
LFAFTDVSLNAYEPIITTNVRTLEGACSGPHYEYWLGKKGEAALPDWTGFEFMDFYRIAPSTFVLDVIDPNDAGKLRYRFMGAKIGEYRRLRKTRT